MTVSIIVPIIYVHHTDPRKVLSEKKRVELFHHCLKSLSNQKMNDGDEIIISECGERPMFSRLAHKMVGHMNGYRYMFTEHVGDISIVPAQYRAMHEAVGDLILYINPDVMVNRNMIDDVKSFYADGDNNRWTLVIGHHLICDDYNELTPIMDRLDAGMIQSSTADYKDDDPVYQYLYHKQRQYTYTTLTVHNAMYDHTNNQIIVFPKSCIDHFTDDGTVSFFSDVMWHWVLSYHGYTAEYMGTSPYFHVITHEQAMTYFSKTSDPSFRKHLYRWIDQYPTEMLPMLEFEPPSEISSEIVDHYRQKYSHIQSRR